MQKNRPASPECSHLLEQSDAYAQSLYPAESNHLVDVSTLEKPSVAFFVARHEGEVVGCCALVDAGDGSAEIKRMFVDPKARGLKIGRKLLETHREPWPRGGPVGRSGLRRASISRKPSALYRTAGYVDIGPFGAYQPDPLSLFMEKAIA